MVSYYLSKYASEKHNVTYLGLTLDQTGESLTLPNVEVKENLCKPGLKGRNEMLNLLKDEITNHDYDVVFTQYFAGISLLKKSLRDENIIVDIRSGYLFANPLKRICLNSLLCLESKYLTPNISINSKLLGKYLGFKTNEIKELPLGAEVIEIPERNFEKLRLIYIGTLTNRNVDLTIEGLNSYIKNNPNHKIERYDIVGSGSTEEEHLILKLLDEYNLKSIVKMHGYVPREKTGALLQNANIGISFVPITPYYDLQPVTKTLEFLLAGLPVIATKTKQNKLVINASNGVLIKDNIESFAEGLDTISQSIENFVSEKIQDNSLEHTWKNVIFDKYLPYIEKVAKN